MFQWSITHIIYDPLFCSMLSICVLWLWEFTLLHIVSMTYQLRSYSWSLHHLPKFLFHIPFNIDWASLVAQSLKNLPANQKIHVRSFGQEDPPENGMATHSSIFAWEIPWTKELGELQSTGLQRVIHDWVTNTFTSL